MKDDEEDRDDHHFSDINTVDDYFLSSNASSSLRVCCYGSSSPKTPQKYLDEAYNLGKALAKRGHVCVNGAGAFGCMGALNNGCSDNNGKIVGVIHEMWVIDGESHSAFQSGNRELLIARGDDLQERKKLLVKDADALIVLPGGPGTWDELMEMACAKNLGLMDLPIVCVNVDGYYDSLGQMFHRGNQDGLIKLMPHEIFRFESTSIAAVKFIELETFSKKRRAKLVHRKRPILQSQASMIGDAMGYLSNLMTKGGQLQTTHSFSVGDDTDSSPENGNSRKVPRKFSLGPSFLSSLFTFTAGVFAGLGIAMKMSSRNRN